MEFESTEEMVRVTIPLTLFAPPPGGRRPPIAAAFDISRMEMHITISIEIHLSSIHILALALKPARWAVRYLKKLLRK